MHAPKPAQGLISVNVVKILAHRHTVVAQKEQESWESRH